MVDSSIIIKRIMNQLQRRTICHVVSYKLETSFQTYCITSIRRIYFVSKYFHILDKARFVHPVSYCSVECKHTILSSKAFDSSTFSRFNSTIENIHQIFFNQLGSQEGISMYMRIFKLFLNTRIRPYWSTISTKYSISTS